MANDKRFVVGWGISVVLFGACGLLAVMDIVPMLAAAGLFFALLGISLASLSTMGRKEPLMSGGGMGLLVIGSIMTIVAYDMASAVILLFIVLIVAGLGLVLAGLRGGE